VSIALAGGGLVGSAAASAAPANSGVASIAASGPVEPSGTPVDIVTDLDVPWSMLRLQDANDTVLVSERNTGVIGRITASGALDPITTLSDVHHTSGGEDGLLGLATLVDGATRWVYAYLTTDDDNRIVRMVYTDPGDPAEATLGTPQVILSGIKRDDNHNGGRIAFGPDGMLYATVGDTHRRGAPQDKKSLNGKILRMTPTGAVPAGNPFSGSLVYSYGHRNPQGLAWDAEGQLWASELGQDTWDEFNRIVPGGNYGWPTVEGRTNDHRFINPVYQWPTSEASPSGLTYIDGTFFMAALRGQRVWTIHVDSETGKARAVASYVGELGRIRDVAAGPDDSLWIMTNNTARGTTHPGDDRIVQVDLIDSGRVEGTLDCVRCPRADAVRIDVKLQRLTSGSWVTQQTERLTGGPDNDFEFDAVFAGTYRIRTSDAGSDGYAQFTGDEFDLTKGEEHDAGTVRLAGSQLDRDLTGDGLNDVIATTGADSLVRFDGTSPVGFGSEQTIAASWDANATAQVGDFDADGLADVVTRDELGAIWLHRGDGAGGVEAPTQLAPASADQTFLIGPGDWSGDGEPDIITGDTSGGVFLWEGHGTGALSDPVKIKSGWSGYTVIPVGDLSGDRLPDLVVRTPSGMVRLYPGNGHGGFKDRKHLADNWKSYTALIGVGDVTGNGRGDIVVRRADGSLRLSAAMTSGKLKSPVTIPGDGSDLTFSP
jgi:glucose/arabinose dehydrogenase